MQDKHKDEKTKQANDAETKLKGVKKENEDKVKEINVKRDK